jgi:hypothetical protein
MSNTQAFLLGIMTAWAPSLAIFGWFLRRSLLDKLFDEPNKMNR